MQEHRTSLQSDFRLAQSPWQVAGPWKAAFSEALAPEQKVNLDETQGGRKVWRTESFMDGTVIHLKSGDGTATYLFRTINATAAATIQLSLGSDDGIVAWFNGEKILSKDVPRGVAPDQDKLSVNLLPGTNTVLLKIYNRTGDSGFYYSTGHSQAAARTALSGPYPEETALFTKHCDLEQWLRRPGSTALEEESIQGLLQRLAGAGPERERLAALKQAGTSAADPAWLELLLALAKQSERFERARADLAAMPIAPLRLAIQDLAAAFPGQYEHGPAWLQAIDRFEQDRPGVQAGLERGEQAALERVSQLQELRRNALLANPLLDFDKVLLVRRSEQNLGLPQNWQGNSSIDPRTDNEIGWISLRSTNAAFNTVFKPSEKLYVGDVDLHYDADKLLFSSIGSHRHWQIFEVKTDGTGLRQITPDSEPDIDSYDAVYLPDGRIIYNSTSTFQGVPCVGGGDYVANLHRMNADGTGIRRLCFDQDNDWYPTLLPNGRVLYLRWEYTDSAHYYSRVLMSMNPDGTGQAEFYGSNSYWPNSLFYARPIPGSSTRFVGIVSGHHGVPRMGEMVLFDAAKGRQEDSGVIQRFPGYGKPFRSVIKDTLVDESWPKFLHPYPLSDKYYLVSCKPTPSARWGLYLVDIFDNALLLREEPGQAMLEPLPLRKTPPPPALQDRVNLADKTARVFIQDINAGSGLRGVPRGIVKSLRLYQYEYSYRNQGGHYFVGMEGGWDVRRMIGTVPVYADGSASFVIPANTPVAVQPLDQEGKALQLMRSWFVGMPGEYVSCVGCHERQNASAIPSLAEAARRKPSEPQPWRGPKRGFGFVREVQPVLDKYCAGCHDGKRERLNFADASIIPTSGGISALPRSYTELHPYVRRNGPEGDYHTLTPLEFHADTSLLVQILRKGHYNVKLDDEAWDRLITWIDLNVPAYGTFHEVSPIPSNFEKRRYECKKIYAGVEEDIEAIPAGPAVRPAFIEPAPLPPRPPAATLAHWPLTAEKAAAMQAALGPVEMTIDLGSGLEMSFRHIPAGAFVMGDAQGAADEFPTAVQKIDQPFWMGTLEVSLAQYQQFDPNHRNGFYDMHYKDQVRPGYLMDAPTKPVIRVSWQQASAFCQWLSSRTGRQVSLPTEAQWEWACRAGSATPMFYGDLDTDFSHFANLADATISKLAVSGVDPQPISKPDRFWDFVPKEPRFNDRVLHLADCGSYQPNVWGLKDMIGNVAEWTRDNYAPYPYRPTKANLGEGGQRKVVRGGSWAERPKESRAAARLDYPEWQRVYNVGFRVLIAEGEPVRKVAAAPTQP